MMQAMGKQPTACLHVVANHNNISLRKLGKGRGWCNYLLGTLVEGGGGPLGPPGSAPQDAYTKQ